MTVKISNDNGRSTTYTPAQLRKDALFAVKGKGKLTGYAVEVFEGTGRTRLVASYLQADGSQATATVAI